MSPATFGRALTLTALLLVTAGCGNDAKTTEKPAQFAANPTEPPTDPAKGKPATRQKDRGPSTTFGDG